MTQSGKNKKNIKDFMSSNILLTSLKVLMPVFTVRIFSLNEAIVSSIAE
jgi:hypothetical protein